MARRRQIALVAIGALILVGCGSTPHAIEPEVRQAASAAGRELRFKGVNFTAERPAGYDTEAAEETLRKLPPYGINAIALVPYAASRLGSPDLRFPLGMESDSGVRRMSRAARDAGLRVILKPQVWYRGGYPGTQELEGDEDLDKFFERYAEFLRHYARLAEEIEADLLCVGVEFSQLTEHEERWRELIRLTRRHYSGPLTYAANFGEEFESLDFWDELDYIGLDNYYPLPRNGSTSEIARRIEAVHQRFGKPVIFTEVGFSSYEGTLARPWENQPSESYSAEEQAQGYEAIFNGFHDKPWMEGMFWWKLGSDGTPGRRNGAHVPWGKPAMDVLKSWYLRL